MKPMDLIAFTGKKGIEPSELLSTIIEDVTHGPSHVAPVRWGITPDHPEVTIVQSTLNRKINGVVNTELGAELLSYPVGSTAYWHRRLVPPTAGELMTFYANCGACDGRAHYSVAELFGFLLGRSAEDVVGLTFGAVCSVWTAVAYGWPEPQEYTPIKCVEHAGWGAGERIL
jgi:hypothetical protein